MQVLMSTRVRRSPWFCVAFFACLPCAARANSTLCGEKVPRPIPFAARLTGKIVTSAQLLALAAILLYPPAVSAVVLVVGVASIASIADYTLMLWRSRERLPSA